MTLLFETLMTKLIPHTIKCVCFAFIIYPPNVTISCPAGLLPVIVGQPGCLNSAICGKGEPGFVQLQQNKIPGFFRVRKHVFPGPIATLFRHNFDVTRLQEPPYNHQYR